MIKYSLVLFVFLLNIDLFYSQGCVDSYIGHYKIHIEKAYEKARNEYKSKGVKISKDQSILFIDAVKNKTMILKKDSLIFLNSDSTKQIIPFKARINKNKKDCDLISNQEPFEMNERFYTLVRIDSNQINLERTGNLSKDMTYFTWKKIK